MQKFVDTRKIQHTGPAVYHLVTVLLPADTDSHKAEQLGEGTALITDCCCIRWCDLERVESFRILWLIYLFQDVKTISDYDDTR
jgi:hypothetical protein